MPLLVDPTGGSDEALFLASAADSTGQSSTMLMSKQRPGFCSLPPPNEAQDHSRMFVGFNQYRKKMVMSVPFQERKTSPFC